MPNRSQIPPTHPSQAKAAPSKAGGQRHPEIGADAMGIAGWMMACELLALLRDAGVITVEQGADLIARSIADANRAAAKRPHPAFQRTRRGLELYLAGWQKVPPDRSRGRRPRQSRPQQPSQSL
jgi:hypothetical protein